MKEIKAVMNNPILEKTQILQMQKGYAKVVEWYGGKDPLFSLRNCDVNSPEVKKAVEEFGLLVKQLSQVKNEDGLMLAYAQYYRNEKIMIKIDENYGIGASDFFAAAIESFYKSKQSFF